MAVVTSDLSIILTQIYIQDVNGAASPRSVVHRYRLRFTVVKLHSRSMSDGGMSHYHMSDTARMPRKDRRL